MRQLDREDRRWVAVIMKAILEERDAQAEQAEHRMALLRLMRAAGIPNDEKAEAHLEALGLTRRLDDGVIVYLRPGPRAQVETMI